MMLIRERQRGLESSSKSIEEHVFTQNDAATQCTLLYNLLISCKLTVSLIGVFE